MGCWRLGDKAKTISRKLYEKICRQGKEEGRDTGKNLQAERLKNKAHEKGRFLRGPQLGTLDTAKPRKDQFILILIEQNLEEKKDNLETIPPSFLIIEGGDL